MPRRDLRGRDALLVSALLTSPSRKDAAKAAGVSDATAARRLRDPRFLALLDEAVQEIARAGLRQALTARPEAIEALRAAMNNSAFPAAARVTAASRLYELGLRHEEQADLRERMDRIEQRQAERDALDSARGTALLGAPIALGWNEDPPVIDVAAEPEERPE